MRNPRTLRVYPMALDLAAAVYETTTWFPRTEQFGLSSQMRRASVSVGSNIAEGCGRRGDPELTNFLYYANGSASELDFQIELARRLGFGRPQDLVNAAALTVDMKKMLAGLLKRTNTR